MGSVRGFLACKLEVQPVCIAFITLVTVFHAENEVRASVKGHSIGIHQPNRAGFFDTGDALAVCNGHVKKGIIRKGNAVGLIQPGSALQGNTGYTTVALGQFQQPVFQNSAH